MAPAWRSSATSDTPWQVSACPWESASTVSRGNAASVAASSGIETVVALAREGVKRLVLVAPGFAADCLETLDELGHELREVFLRAGGEEFACIPCLNDSPAGIGLLAALARRELSGWTH